MLDRTDTKSPKQARSELMRRNILAAGHRLLLKGEFEKASIAEIAAEAKCSVGAFYRRFEDKSAYETELLQAALMDGVNEIEEVFRVSLTTSELCQNVAVRIVHRHRLYREIYRTALVRTIMAPETFLFTKKHSMGINQRFIHRIEELEHRQLDNGELHRVQMALQMFHGTVVNAQVTRPGPLYLDDDAFLTLLSAAFTRLILGAIGKREGAA